MITLKQKKILKLIVFLLEIVAIILMLVFSIAFFNKNNQLKQEKIKVKSLTEQVDSLQKVNHALGAENVLTVNVTFEINQKNILSFNQTNAQNVAKEVSTLTRKELYDSLYANKPKQ